MTQTRQLLFLALWCLYSSSYCQNVTKCLQVDNQPGCVAKCKNGVIDLTPIAAKGPEAPKFKGLLDTNGFEYSYNPCYGYSEGRDCPDVHICQRGRYNPNLSFAIADFGTEEIYLDENGNPFVHYRAGFREVRVRLHCTESHTIILSTTGDMNRFGFFEFDVFGCVVCPGGCKSPP